MIVVNPIMSSGLSLSKLQAATAAPEDVLASKTFYSGDKKLRTGSLVPVKFVSGSFSFPLHTHSLTVNLGFRPKVVVCTGTGDWEYMTAAYSENPSVSLGAYKPPSGTWSYYRGGLYFTSSGFSVDTGSSYPFKELAAYSYCAFG